MSATAPRTALPPQTRRLGTKLGLALLGTALVCLLAFTLMTLPLLRDSIRDDRVLLFVEQSTRALAENVSHAVELYRSRVQTTAASLALLPAGQGRSGASRDALRLLNAAARQPVPGLLEHGIFDLLLVVSADGTILYANTSDRFGDPLNTTALWRKPLRSFPPEYDTFLAARAGLGKHDWYCSMLVASVNPAAADPDVCRLHSIAFALPVPNSSNVLLAVVNWEAVQKILDDVETPMQRVGFPSAYAFMFANDSDTIIAHKFRDPARVNNYGTSLLRQHHLPSLHRAVQQGLLSHRYEYPPGSPKVSGLSRVDDPDFGWTVGLGINDSDVIAPVRALVWRLAGIGLAIFFAGLALAYFLSHRITSDLRHLTDSVRRIGRGVFGERVEVRSRDEVGQLAAAFNQMTETLVARDTLILAQQKQILEQRRIEQELRIAAEVQKRLFPQFRPHFTSLDYVGFCRPARSVSGDYYDFLPVGPGLLGLLVADVCGKGISAALLMASLHACVRTHAPLYAARCGQVISTVNSLLYAATDDTHFATMLYAVYDESTALLTYINAGHHPALLVRPANGAAAAAAAGSALPLPRQASAQPACIPLESHIPPVGIFESVAVEHRTVQLARGDLLVLYSDGILEAAGEDAEEFGRRRLTDLLLRNHHLPAAALGEAILDAVGLHCGAHSPADDLTLIVARVL